MKKSDIRDEQELITALREGSMTAFESLFQIYNQKLFRFSLSYLKSETEAEDILQEVFLKIWQNKQALKSNTSFQSYLFTIAFHAIQKSFNKKSQQQRFKLEIFDQLVQDLPELEDEQDFETLLSKLNLLIDQMPERRKEIFIKRKKEGLSVRQIALDMGISEKTVENQITEAMHSLRKSFGEEGLNGKLFSLLFLQ